MYQHDKVRYNIPLGRRFERNEGGHNEFSAEITTFFATVVGLIRDVVGKEVDLGLSAASRLPMRGAAKPTSGFLGRRLYNTFVVSPYVIVRYLYFMPR